jgi:hypothetical protein
VRKIEQIVRNDASIAVPYAAKRSIGPFSKRLRTLLSFPKDLGVEPVSRTWRRCSNQAPLTPDTLMAPTSHVQPRSARVWRAGRAES